MPIDKKNVLFIINQLHSGGAERTVASLSVALAAECNVFIVTFNDPGREVYPHAGTLLRISLPFSKKHSENGFLIRMIRMFVLAFKLTNIKRKLKVDIAISFLDASNICNLISRGPGVKIISVRSYLSRELGSVKRLGIYRRLIKLLYNLADGIIVPSGLIKTDLITSFNIVPGKVQVFYNFLDIGKIISLRQVDIEYPILERVLKTSPFLLNLGRVETPKGQVFLLLLLSKLKRSIPDLRLVIIGDGPLRKQLQLDAARLGLKVCTIEQLNSGYENVEESDVFFMGAQSNPFKYFRYNSTFVFPSLYEGFPNAIIEAMACSIPVVSSDCFSGPREILAPDTLPQARAVNLEFAKYGVLVPELKPSCYAISDDTDHSDCLTNWETAILKMFSDAALRTAYAAGSGRRAHDFSRENILPDWLRLINETNATG